ncbi:hypothetical protein MMC28_003106 [Mycoblastus sanguinarius]|nr:hypothetical protein [Mycoblastus sanguinarius]
MPLIVDARSNPLQDVISLSEDIEQFMTSFVQNRRSMSTSIFQLPLSLLDLNSIRLAFWHLQLYGDIFHFSQLEACPSCEDFCHHEMSALEIFFDHFSERELEELDCVFYYLKDVFRRSKMETNGTEPAWIQRISENCACAADARELDDGAFNDGDNVNHQNEDTYEENLGESIPSLIIHITTHTMG